MAKRVHVADGVTIYLKGSTWMVDLAVDGKRIRQSLKTTDERAAINKAVAMAGGVTSLTARTETISEVAARYMKEYVIPNLRPGTVRSIKAHVEHFMASLPTDAIPAQVQRADVEKWRDAFKARGVSGHTTNTAFGYVRAFLNWCLYKELMDKKVCEGIKRVKVNQTIRTTWTGKEIGTIMRAMVGNETLADFVMILANTGLRPSELLHVRGMDWDPTGSMLSIRAWGGWKTKDSEDRMLRVNSAVAGILNHRTKTSGLGAVPVFAGPKGNVRDVNQVGRKFSYLLPEEFDHKAGLYEFRHYAATSFVKAGWTLEQTRRYLGHADPQTTAQYYVNATASELVGAPPVVEVGAVAV